MVRFVAAAMALNAIFATVSSNPVPAEPAIQVELAYVPRPDWLPASSEVFPRSLVEETSLAERANSSPVCETSEGNTANVQLVKACAKYLVAHGAACVVAGGYSVLTCREIDGKKNAYVYIAAYTPAGTSLNLPCKSLANFVENVNKKCQQNGKVRGYQSIDPRFYSESGGAKGTQSELAVFVHGPKATN